MIGIRLFQSEMDMRLPFLFWDAFIGKWKDECYGEKRSVCAVLSQYLYHILRASAVLIIQLSFLMLVLPPKSMIVNRQPVMAFFQVRRPEARSFNLAAVPLST